MFVLYYADSLDTKTPRIGNQWSNWSIHYKLDRFFFTQIFFLRREKNIRFDKPNSIKMIEKFRKINSRSVLLHWVSTTSPLCKHIRMGGLVFTRPFNPNNRPNKKREEGKKYIEDWMVWIKRTRHSFDRTDKRAENGDETNWLPYRDCVYIVPFMEGRKREKKYYKQMCTIKFCGCHSKLRYEGFASSEFGNIFRDPPPYSLAF